MKWSWLYVNGIELLNKNGRILIVNNHLVIGIKNHQAVIQDFVHTVDKKDKQIEQLKKLVKEAYGEGFNDARHYDLSFELRVGYNTSEVLKELNSLFPKEALDEIRSQD
jgi:hypothetical protein